MRPSQPDPASTLALASMETRGTSTEEGLLRTAAAELPVQKAPPPVASTIGCSFLSVAVTSLISMGSSMPACATAVSSPDCAL